MSDAKVAFYRSIGLSGSLPDMENAFFEGSFRKVPYILAQSAVPVCLAPNGTVATNGIVTLGTALSATYSGGIWLRLPANAVVGGAAGLYWAVMSSATQGQVYANFADPASEFIPFVPSGALVAAAGSNAAYTQTTGATVTLINVTLPDNSLGANGQLRINEDFLYNTAAGNKVLHLGVGGVGNARASTRTTTGGADSLTTRFKNMGVSNKNRAYSASESSSVSTGGVYLSVDTSATLSITCSAQIDTATNWAMYQSVCIEVLPS